MALYVTPQLLRRDVPQRANSIEHWDQFGVERRESFKHCKLCSWKWRNPPKDIGPADENRTLQLFVDSSGLWEHAVPGTHECFVPSIAPFGNTYLQCNTVP